MLVEKSRAEAIKAFLSGRKVNVLTEFEDGSMAVESIEAILSEEDTRYLVDVPAVDEKDSMKGELLPPPSRGRRQNNLRPENQKRN